MSLPALTRDGEALSELAARAGEAIMAIYRSPFDTRIKADDSPVTEADEKAEAIILAGLASLAPGIPVVAEESAAAGRVPDVSSGRFWLVDPLDGTTEFVKRNGEFTVNIALIEDGRPVRGVVHLPAMDTTYVAEGPGRAFRICGSGAPQPIACRAADPAGLDVVASRSYRDAETDAYLKTLPVRQLVSAGSSLKFCRVAEGAADLYPRFGRTMEWDTAAGQAVLEAAGGSVSTIEGAPFRYGKPSFANPGFIARGRV